MQQWVQPFALLKHGRDDPKRVVTGMAGPEHPLVPPDGPDAGADLVGKGLEPQAPVRRGECAGNPIPWPAFRLYGQKPLDGLLESTIQEVFVGVKRDPPARGNPLTGGNVKAVNRVEEKECAHLLVQAASGVPEFLEGMAFGQKLRERGGEAEGVKRPVAQAWIVRKLSTPAQ